MNDVHEEGFTLVEILAALFIFAILIGGILPVLVAQAQRNTDMEIRMGAVAAAQERLDEIRVVQDTDSLPTSGSQGPTDYLVNGRTYQVTTSYCNDSSLCTTLYNRHITVEVAFRGTDVFSTQTVYTRLR